MRHAPVTRLRCEVPFCRRTTKRPEGTSAGCRWICAGHWRLTSAGWRKRLKMLRRRRRYDLAGVMWDRLRGQAIERAAGL